MYGAGRRILCRVSKEKNMDYTTQKIVCQWTGSITEKFLLLSADTQNFFDNLHPR